MIILGWDLGKTSPLTKSQIQPELKEIQGEKEYEVE
jgi:hypothetical protein